MYEVNINYLQLLESLKKLLQLKSRARFAWYYWARNSGRFELPYDLMLRVESRDEFLQLTSKQGAV